MPFRLSPSTLSLLKECPRCFWLHHNKNIRRPESIYPSLPYGIDKALKKRFDYYRERNQLPAELRKLENTVLFDHPLIALWRKSKDGIRWKDEKGNELRGAVDDILQKNSRLIVLEHVTRGFALKEDTLSHYQDKLNLYNFLLQKNGFPTENYAYLLFFYPKDVNWRGDVWFHKELHQAAVSAEDGERIFREGIKVLEGGIPESSGDCSFCRWSKQSQ